MEDWGVIVEASALSIPAWDMVKFKGKYELTVQKFFESVYKYICDLHNVDAKRMFEVQLNDLSKDIQNETGVKTGVYDIDAKEAQKYKMIRVALDEIKEVEKQVYKLIQKRKEKIYDANGLREIENKIILQGYDNNLKVFSKPGVTDNSLFLAYRDVVNGICDYYVLPVQEREKLLRPLKRWKYLTSKDKLKDFKFPFLSLSHFVEKMK